MCGITGLIVQNAHMNTSAVLRDMTNIIAHRGPDDEGFFETTSKCGKYRIGLGHRRLSIIDLHTGHQPLGNEDGSIQIIFNGEIYNFKELREKLIACGHSFKTTSDTETIVHAYEEYGDKCVELFRGMFAFAIWDSNRQRLFLARDRFGKKLLFFYHNNNVLTFSSEIKSLLEFPVVNREIDQTAIWNYFSYRYVPGPRTLFKHIKKLLPGSYAVWQQGIFSCKQYYKPPDCCRNNVSSEVKNVKEKFLNSLDEAVKIRMVSDVPFGAFLSGGIDSSAIVALMTKHSTLPIKTFSIGFSESEYNELDYAKTVANIFHTEHHELIISENDLIDELPKLIRFRDAPISEPSDIPIYLLSREARKTVKMVLTGEGSDEILGGYPKHLFETYTPYYQHIPKFFREHVIEKLINALPYSFRRWKTAVQAMGITDPGERMARWFGALSYKEQIKLLALHKDKLNPGEPLYEEYLNTGNTLKNILCFDQISWPPDNLLERGDRMTMAASLEARMPFMDHILIEFVSSLNNNMRIRGKHKKWLLRACMKQILPHKILNRPKVGFRVPVNKWFQGPMRDYLYDHLTEHSSYTREYYTKPYLENILHEHTSGRQNHEKLLWTLLNLEIWHREYINL